MLLAYTNSVTAREAAINRYLDCLQPPYLALYGSKGDICKAGQLAQIEGFADVAV